MKIELSNGYVLLKEVLTRRVAREYTAALFEAATVDGEGTVKASPLNVETASETLVLNLVEKIVLVKEGSEEYREANRDWLDNLPQSDFRKLEEAVLRIKSGADQQAKKS